ncbi:MAG: DUF1311 domain-containing protein [Tabrizicola sp.]|nr:DUF1311 domain-containing protein [Tabrizicola sp.]
MIRLTLALLLLSVVPALAQGSGCADPSTQIGLNECAAADWEEADRALNRAYQEVIVKMKAVDANVPDYLKGEDGTQSGEAFLREAQLAWITYRDANCAAAAFSWRGASAEPLAYYGCLREMSLARTQELRNLIVAF